MIILPAEAGAVQASLLKTSTGIQTAPAAPNQYRVHNERQTEHSVIYNAKPGGISLTQQSVA